MSAIGIKRAFGSFKIDNSPVIIAEVRGFKESIIKWRNKDTKQEEQMDKFQVAAEFEDGTQVSLSQMGRDYAGSYPFEKGKKYVFAVTKFQRVKDALLADFSDAMLWVNGVVESAPAKPLAASAGK